MQTQYATQSVTLAAADDVRTEELLGREHVVAPVTLVREMVLKGEFLPFEEIEATQLAWNAKPGTISHPRNDAGDFVPASHPSQYESHKAATLFDVETSSAGRSLDGEIWVDRERSAQVAASLDRDDPADLLLDGDTVEVSVGYWYQRFEADGEFDGTEFDAVQVGIQPDHLALLPNAEGECSIENGCGAGRDDAAGAAMASSAGLSTPLSMLQRGADRLGLSFGAACADCGGSCDAHDTEESTATTTDTESAMNDQITRLAEHSAFDAETLEAWEESQLDALEESLDLDANDTDRPDGTDPSDPDAQTNDQLTADDVQDIVESALEADRKQRTEPQRQDLIQEIQAHTSLEADQLPEDVEALEALAAEVTPTGGVYAGAAGTATSATGADSDMPIGVGDRYLEEAE